MKVYKTQEEVNADLDKNGNLFLDCSVMFNVSVSIKGDISACDIKACDINAGDINAGDINAWNIKAGDISFFAFCCAYHSIKCKSWNARRTKYHAPICIDGELLVEQKDGAK